MTTDYGFSPKPKLQFFTGAGVPLVGGKVYTYAAGTTTPLATYKSAALDQEHRNPIILDARGEVAVWIANASYKFVIYDSDDVLQDTVDNIDALDASFSENPLTFYDDAGDPLSGGFLYTYLAGTTVPATTYSELSGPTANANPIVLDASGQATVILVANTGYKFALKEPDGSLVWVVDNIRASPLSLVLECARITEDGAFRITETRDIRVVEQC